jgi:hypothetical protein
MKTITNSGDFTGSHIRISSDVCHCYSFYSLYNNTDGVSKGIGSLNQPLKMPTANPRL